MNEFGGGFFPIGTFLQGARYHPTGGTTYSDVVGTAYRGLGALGYSWEDTSKFFIPQRYYHDIALPLVQPSNFYKRLTYDPGAEMHAEAQERGYYLERQTDWIETALRALRSLGYPEGTWTGSPAWDLFQQGPGPDPPYPGQPPQQELPETAPPDTGSFPPSDPLPVDPVQPPTGGRFDPTSLIEYMLRIWQSLQGRGQPSYNQNYDIRFPGAAPTRQPSSGGTRDMAYVNTSVLGGGETGGGFWNAMPDIIGAIGNQFRSMPGGAPVRQMNFDVPFMDIVPQGQGSCMTGLTSPFSPGGGRGLRAKTHIQCDPITGRPVWFKPAGRPILWSGDLSACKRVRKVASRARRARGGR